MALVSRTDEKRDGSSQLSFAVQRQWVAISILSERTYVATGERGRLIGCSMVGHL